MIQYKSISGIIKECPYYDIFLVIFSLRKLPIVVCNVCLSVCHSWKLFFGANLILISNRQIDLKFRPLQLHLHLRSFVGGQKWNSADLEAVRLHFDKEIHDVKRLTEDKLVQTIANVDILRQRTTVQLKSKIHYMIKPSHLRRKPTDL